MKNYGSKILFLIAFIFSIPAFSQNLCADLFATPRSFQAIDTTLDTYLGKKVTPLEILDLLRFINDDPESFQNAELSRFKNYLRSSQIEFDWGLTFLKIKVKDPQIKVKFLRRTKILVPKRLPKDKKDLAEFLIQFAITLEDYQLNLNTIYNRPIVSGFRKVSLSERYANASAEQLKKLDEKFLKIEAAVDRMDGSSLQSTLLKARIMFLVVQTELAILYKTFGPAEYLKRSEQLLRKYDSDVYTLFSALKGYSPKVQEKDLKVKSLVGATLESVLSLWRLLVPISFDRFLSDRVGVYTPNSVYNQNFQKDFARRQYQLGLKWVADKAVVLSVTAWMWGLAQLPGQLEHNLPMITQEVQSLVTQVGSLHLDKDKFQQDFQDEYQKELAIAEAEEKARKN